MFSKKKVLQEKGNINWVRQQNTIITRKSAKLSIHASYHKIVALN